MFDDEIKLSYGFHYGILLFVNPEPIGFYKDDWVFVDVLCTSAIVLCTIMFMYKLYKINYVHRYLHN